jgi:hypothetical protein
MAKDVVAGKVNGRYPYILSTRTQQSKGWDSEGKTRDIWMAPKVRVAVDGMFTGPIVARLARTPTNSAWIGPSAVNAVMTQVLNLRGPFLSSDISGFDQSVSYDLFLRLYELKIAAFGEQYRALLEDSRDHIALDGIVTPDGVYHGKVRGLASGNGNTSLDGTCIQEVVMNYCAIRLGVSLLHLSVMGDDGVLAFDTFPNLDEWAEVMAEVGFEANVEKQFVHDSAVHYLQNLHMREYQVNGLNVGVRSVHRMLNRASSLERMRQFPPSIAGAMMSIRALMQFNTCVYHPQFRAAVQYLVEGDELLQRSDPVEILDSVGVAKAESALRQQSFNLEQVKARDMPGLPITSLVRDVKLARPTLV